MSYTPKASILKDPRAKRDLAILLVGLGALAAATWLALHQSLTLPYAVLCLFWALCVFAVIDFCAHAWRTYINVRVPQQ
jgi:hypothetical protein